MSDIPTFGTTDSLYNFFAPKAQAPTRIRKTRRGLHLDYGQFLQADYESRLSYPQIHNTLDTLEGLARRGGLVYGRLDLQTIPGETFEDKTVFYIGRSDHEQEIRQRITDIVAQNCRNGCYSPFEKSTPHHPHIREALDAVIDDVSGYMPATPVAEGGLPEWLQLSSPARHAWMDATNQFMFFTDEAMYDAMRAAYEKLKSPILEMFAKYI